jgi:ABC-type glycerol-3-phosphate transport system substrate-binding protein
MRRLDYRVWLGLFVVAAIFAICLGRATFFKTQREQASGKTVIRFCHYSLQPTVRRAFQEVFAEYERRRPDVQVVEMPIPESAYPQFMRTKLVGGMAPDVVQLGHHFPGMEDLQTAYFAPLTWAVEQPNPYNAGTPSSGRRWRETFVDGLGSNEAYNAAQHQYYGVSLQVATIRVHYNVALLKKITGQTALPETYEQFIALCDRVTAYAQRTGTAVNSMAASRLSGLLLLSALFSSVNQRLYFELSRDHSLALSPEDYPKAYLRGDWSFATPSIRVGFGFAELLGRYMRPGFLQMSQTDANFEFLQGQALMLLSFSNDGASLMEQASFAVKPGIFPLPTPQHAAYGRYVLGPVSEAANRGVTTFGVTLGSAHREAALDLLRFLGSVPGNTIFSRYSRFVPVIEGVRVPPESAVYRPNLAGYPGQFFAAMFGRYFDGLPARYYHLLFAHTGGAGAYCEQMDKSYAAVAVAGLERGIREGNRDLRLQELTFLASCAQEARLPSGSAGPHSQTAALAFEQNYAEARMLQTRFLLHQWRKSPKAE